MHPYFARRKFTMEYLLKDREPKEALRYFEGWR